MNSPRCEYCGHLNHADAENCAGCDFPVGADRGGRAAGAWGQPRRAPGVTFGAGAPDDAIPAPPFKGAGDVISPMLAVYRKHFTLVGILVLVATVPEALIRYGVLDLTGAGIALVSTGIDLGSARGVFFWLLALASGALLSGSLVHAVVGLQRAGGASAGECLSRGLAALPRVFLLSLLYTVMVIAGYVLLVVPGVILSLMFAVSIPALVVEGLGPVAALKRSHELTKGYKGLLFITYFLWGVLIFVLNWVVMWSFVGGVKIDLLPSLLVQTAVLGMLNSSLHVLTVYIYLGLLRERQGGAPAGAFAAAAG